MSTNKANKIIIEASSPAMHKTRLYTFDKDEVVIGRSFACDVIVEDDFVSPEHIKINLVKNGAYEVKDLGSENGTSIRKAVIHEEAVTLKSGQSCKIGKTRLRIYTADHEIRPTRRLNFGTKLQVLLDNAAISFLLFAFSVFFGTLYSWNTADPQKFMDEDVYMAVFAFAASIITLAIIGAIGKIVSHKKSQFTGEISSYSLIVFLLVIYIWFVEPYLFFYVPTMFISWTVTISVTMVFFVALGVFASYIEEGRVVRKTMGFAVILGAFIAGLSLFDDIGYNDMPRYPSQILVGDYSGLELQSPEEFIEHSAKLFDRAGSE